MARRKKGRSLIMSGFGGGRNSLAASWGSGGKRGAGSGLIPNTYSGKRKGHKGGGLLAIFGRRKRRGRGGAVGMASAAFYDRSTKHGNKLVNLFGSGGKKGGKPAAGSMMSVADGFESWKAKRKAGAGSSFVSLLSSVGVIIASQDDPRYAARPADQDSPLPDVPVQEGADSQESVLVRLREFTQSLSRFPDDPPSVIATFRELIQSLPPVKYEPPQVFDRIRGYIGEHTTPYPAPPKSVFREIGDYLRSLRPRGKRS